MAIWRGDRAAKSQARWSAAAEQAAKQSRRAWFPEVTAQADLAGAVRRAETAALAIVLDPDASESLTIMELPDEGEIVLAVGPEGGVAPAETKALLAAGARAARLGADWPPCLDVAGVRRRRHPAQPHSPLGLTRSDRSGLAPAGSVGYFTCPGQPTTVSRPPRAGRSQVPRGCPRYPSSPTGSLARPARSLASAGSPPAEGSG